MNETNSADQKVWDARKITIFLFILAASAGILYYGLGNQRFLSEDKIKGVQIEEKNVEESRVDLPTFGNLQTTFEEKFNEIREDAESIDVSEVASSSPEIQKVINDIKS